MKRVRKMNGGIALSEKARAPFCSRDRMFLAKARPSLWKQSSVALRRVRANGKCFATVATSSDFDEVMNLVKSAFAHHFTRRQRSIDYFYAGCMLPECMKVPFFVAVSIGSFLSSIAMLQHGGCGRARPH